MSHDYVRSKQRKINDDSFQRRAMVPHRPTRTELYADLAQAVRNTASAPMTVSPDLEGNSPPMQSRFTRKAKGVERPGGKVQLNVQFPKDVFEKIATEAFASNRSFSAQALHFIERGMAEEMGTTHSGASALSIRAPAGSDGS